MYGETTTTSGPAYAVFGRTLSAGGTGVAGQSSAYTGTNFGVWGATNSPNGYGVYYSGGLGGTGKMTAIVSTSKGPTALGVHTTAGDWVEDFGEGQLVDGRCHIELDPLFLETVTVDAANPMKVFIQLLDECSGTRVIRSHTGFDVIELHAGDSHAAFMYRVVAKRRGFESKRLDYCKAAENDSYLYPELRDKEHASAAADSQR